MLLIPGNVVTQTSDLSDAQQQALAAWEEEEKRRKRERDAFEFTD